MHCFSTEHYCISLIDENQVYARALFPRQFSWEWSYERLAFKDIKHSISLSVLSKEVEPILNGFLG